MRGARAAGGGGAAAGVAGVCGQVLASERGTGTATTVRMARGGHERWGRARAGAARSTSSGARPRSRREAAGANDGDGELHEVVVDAAKCGREGHRSAREVFEEMPERGGGGGRRRLMLTGGPILSEMRLEEAKRAISRLGSFLPRISEKVVVFGTKS